MSAAIASTAHPKGTGAPGSADSSDIEDSFFPALIDVCQQVGCNPADLLAVIKAESNVCPGAVNPHGGATGLIQFMPETMKRLGWSEPMQVFAELSATDQLPWVQQFLKAGKGQFTSPGRIYQFIFLPGTMSTATQPGDAVASKDSPTAAIAAAYASNEALDINKDGKITIQELTTRMQGQEAGGRWTALVTRLKAAQAGGAQAPPAAGGAQAPTPSASSSTQPPDAAGGATTPGASGSGAPDSTSQASEPNTGAEADSGASDSSAATSDPSSTSEPATSASDRGTDTSESSGTSADEASAGATDASSSASEPDAGASDSSPSSETDTTDEENSTSSSDDSSSSSEASAESPSES